ncbi:hypothetical protein [Tellurirhabdus bombi]|uniref:hypothetical protein n=1 Tax=Tellurirhabdus bombi TaxID=2907205 RepID=UPI001F31BBCA|nr:hypothetical protein [Tellurirhabdus bombi]
MDKESLIKFVKQGGEIAGGVVGGAIGLLGGVAGAVGGGAAGVVTAKVVAEVAERFLSDREKIRVAVSATYVLSGINDRLGRGDQVRNDNFFAPDELKRSKAEELFEGVLLKCKDAYEEKKIKFISKIFESTIFQQNIVPEDANQILITAETLSYRKLCILALVRKNKLNQLNGYNLSEQDYSQQQIPINIQLILQDYLDLLNLGLMMRGDNIMVPSIKYIVTNQMQLTLLGELYADIMYLDDLSVTEIDSLGIIF